jgi:hypothetical protein
LEIPAHLVDFLESGVAILVGTRDASLHPETARACGAVVERDRRKLTVFLSERWPGVFENLRDNGQIATNFVRPHDHYSIQLKGDGATLRPATAAERSIVERWHAGWIEQLWLVGIPRSISKRFHIWPAHAVTFDVHDIFVQTPGPGAGKRLEPA